MCKGLLEMEDENEDARCFCPCFHSPPFSSVKHHRNWLAIFILLLLHFEMFRHYFNTFPKIVTVLLMGVHPSDHHPIFYYRPRKKTERYFSRNKCRKGRRGKPIELVKILAGRCFGAYEAVSLC